MIERALRLAETTVVLGLLCGSAALFHVAHRRDARRAAAAARRALLL